MVEIVSLSQNPAVDWQDETIALMNNFTPEFLALGLIRYVVFLFSTTCHEASHALAAKLGGDPTAFHSGQVSLNPVPHIRRELFGMVIVPLLALVTGGAMIGWASAPYDPLWKQRHPRRAAWMSLAGPGANFTLVLIAAIFIHAGIFAGVMQPPQQLNSLHLVEATAPGIWDGAAKLLSVLFSLNLLLGIFNLLPVPPLDGFGVVPLFLSKPLAVRWDRLEQTVRSYSIFALLLCWQLFDRIYGPIFGLGVTMLYPNSGYESQ